MDPVNNLPLKRDDFLISNVLRCRPPDNKLSKQPFEHDAIRNCSPYLTELLNQVKPRVIMPLGNTPMRWFTGHWGIEKRRGYVYDSPYGLVLPTYHPSYIQRGNWHLTRVWQHDLMKALAVARLGKIQAAKFYQCDPPPQALARFIAEYAAAGYPPLAFDIETPYSARNEKDGDIEAGMDDEEDVVENDPSYTILRISFSFKPFQAISVPWTEPYITLCKQLLGLPGWKLVHNQHFDCPRLLNAGVVFGGPIVDNMDVWHHFEPSWPAGLKYIATFATPDMHYWKDESGTNPAWYNAADSDVLLRCFNYGRAGLEKQGRWESFDKQYIQLRIILDRMSNRGVRTDRDIRKKGFDHFLQEMERCIAELQHIAPLGCRKVKVFKSSEEKLRKEGKWEEGKMVQVRQLVPVPLQTWYAIGTEGQLLGKVRTRGQAQAYLLLQQLTQQSSFGLSLEKPASPKKRKKRDAPGVENPQPGPTSTSSRGKTRRKSVALPGNSTSGVTDAGSGS
jgi:hypothetical protein